MRLRESYERLGMSPDAQCVAQMVEECLIDIGARSSTAPVLTLYMLDCGAKQIGDVFDMTADAVNTVTQREQQRLEVSGKGTLALRTAASPKFVRGMP